MSFPATSPIVWVVTEGLTGTENQCLGIAEAMGVTPIVKRVTLRQPWKLLSPYLGFECAFSFTEPLTEPWPDLLIASGRKSIAAARYIKKQNPKTFTVQVQDPRVNPKQFDMVVVPRHDPTRGDNVTVTVATPNRITPDKLTSAKNNFALTFRNLESPRIAVLIGGTTKRHNFTAEDTKSLIKKLSPFKNMMMTTSRRTGEENVKILRQALAPHPNLAPQAGKELQLKSSPLTGEGLGGGDNATHQNYFWDGTSPNPYMGMLAYADFILVTADSTSMISEAATTGKPVYVIPMKGLTKRQNQLIENLKSYGAVREFTGILEQWHYPPLNDSAQIAAIIRQKCGLFS